MKYVCFVCVRQIISSRKGNTMRGESSLSSMYETCTLCYEILSKMCMLSYEILCNYVLFCCVWRIMTEPVKQLERGKMWCNNSVTQYAGDAVYNSVRGKNAGGNPTRYVAVTEGKKRG